ncbi:STAS domain-containing protein [Azohydromonas caseinilytica]|uniref:STAS domain-containing protein n=1 Tax=Azohydromonas caseinilytica TaxID=2728836 RepID=A0A848F947_9BURK|nr:STAS domain-containing protein [Azohydromonas caseinilytica]NML15336.1 STAS domain-containing protein [Azohydromonas caseinilytica]
MAEPKDGTSFLRKVVRLVAPTGAEGGSPTDDSTLMGLERSELKAMIERKRRNDFVRKREFDMLRKLRREGMASAAALEVLHLDTEPRADTPGAQPAENGVKAKIDAIEQQMVGDATPASRALARSAARSYTTYAPAPGTGSKGGSEVMQDPLLDEAVIAFANGEFVRCEQLLAELTGPGGLRANHAETWLVRLDLYRATGAQAAFETLAAEFAQRFHRSPPQWFSLPQRLTQLPPPAGAAPRPGQDWACPAVLDAAAVQRLQDFVREVPQPWVLDWSGLQHVHADAPASLAPLLQAWAGQPLHMHWLGSDMLLQRLREATPAGVRDTDPALWLLRLQALRLLHRAQAFDEAAIDYCITYEISPPPWEPPSCRVRLTREGLAAPSSTLGSSTTATLVSDFESSLHDSSTVEVELAGQLVGDIGPTLRRLQQQLGNAVRVDVRCARLVRVDFNAAGALLKWVQARRQENRSLGFSDTHRLVALLLGAMGINEHARVRVHNT